MSIALDSKKSFFGVNSCYGFIFATYTITDLITKCDSYFTTNRWQKFITKYVRFFITKQDSFITKQCDWNVTNSHNYLAACAVKIVRIKITRRNKLYNDNYSENDYYDFKNNQFNLSLRNAKPSD